MVLHTQQPLNVVIISKYFTDIFNTTIGKELATMLLYFRKKFATPYCTRKRLLTGTVCRSPTVTYLQYCVSGSTLTAVGRFQLLARWPAFNEQH